MNPDRPTPTIDYPNEAQRLREHLEATRQQFESLPDIVGVTLDGGLARGYGNEHARNRPHTLSLGRQVRDVDEWHYQVVDAVRS